MHIPYVIDNIDYPLGAILDGLLRSGDVNEMDIATAYFSIRGYQQVRESLPQVRKFRLMLGDEPDSADDVGLTAQLTRLSASRTECRTAHARYGTSG